MPKPIRTWRDFPPQFIAVFQSLAATPPPVTCGPFSKNDADVFRRSFYNFRDSLKGDASVRDGSLPARMLEGLEVLSAKIEPSSDNPTEHNLIFYLHPVIVEANKIDPADAQRRQLSQVQFAVSQRLLPISTSMFTDDEMEERIQEIKEG